eukprot:gene3652-15298_t
MPPRCAAAAVDTPYGRRLALDAAVQGAVLLRNEGGILPLDFRQLRRVALIGPLADDAA